MISDAIRRYPSWRGTVRALCCALLLAAASPFVTAWSIHAQPADIDWRATLIVRFDPAVHAPAPDPDVTYLAHIADGLESGWIAEIGARAIAVEPFYVQGKESKIDYSYIEPTLGSAEDWNRLMSAARRGHVAVAVQLTHPLNSEDYSTLARWASEAGIRHFIVDGGIDVSALRAALDATISGTSWIAGTSDGGGGALGAGGGEAARAGDGEARRASGGGAAGADDDEASRAGGGGATRAGDGGATRAGGDPVGAETRDADTPRSGSARFDAVIESVSLDDIGDDVSLGVFYRGFAHRSTSAPQPLVAAVALSPEADHLTTARALMLPGALHLTTAAVPPDSSELWRRIMAFRARHPAMSRGEHVDLVTNTFAFARTATESGSHDNVVVVLGASGSTTLNVSRIFPDNAMLLDALTGRTAFVSFGMATFEAGPSGVILVEESY